MGALPFDTLKVTRTLREKAHFTHLEQRLTLEIGGMFVVSIGVPTALVEALP